MVHWDDKWAPRFSVNLDYRGQVHKIGAALVLLGMACLVGSAHS